MIVAKYKFDKSIYENFIPVFNDGYTGYTISDEIDSVNSNHIIRTIECGTLPTRIDFGVGGNAEQYTNRSDSLLAIYNLDTSAITDGNRMVKGCRFMTEINTSDWDTSNMTDMSGMFGYCYNLTSLDVSNFDTSKVTNIAAMFINCNKLTSLDVSNFDTRNVTDMGGMFHNCTNLTSIDVSNWDTSNVTNMAAPYVDDVTSTLRNGIFSHCKSLTSLDVSKWDTSKVTDMGGMFWVCSSLTSLDLSNWDTSNVTNLTNMFDDCSNLTRIEGIENWIVDNVDNFNAVFNDCCKLRNLDLSRWNVKPEARLTGIFNSNKSSAATMNLVYLDIRNWEIDETNVHYTSNSTGELVRVPVIADRNTKLKYIRNDVTTTVDWLASNVVTRTTNDPGYIITEAVVSNETIEAFAAKNWNVVRLADMNTVDIAIYKFDKSIHKWMVPVFDNNFADYFIDDVVEDEVNAPNIVTRTIRSMGGLPTLMRFGYNAPETDDMNLIGKYQALKSVSYVNATEITNMSKMFMYCSRMTDVTFDNMNKNTTTHSMFLGCTYLNTINNLVINNKTTIMYGMFLYCYGLTELDASTWDVSNVTRMDDMFFYCNGLTTVGDISNWNTGKVTNINRMFEWCESLTTLDLSNWNTENVTNMSETFRSCKKLTSINLSNWNTGKVTNMSSMFDNCYKLTSIDVSNFNTSNVTRMEAMFYGCNKLTSLDVSNWNTSNVTNMLAMFEFCNSLNSIDVSNWNTSKVTNLYAMFHDCTSLTSLDVSKWDVSNVTSMTYLFWSCTSLTSLDVSKWNTGNVTAMTTMFGSCQSLISLDVSKWNTSKVAGMDYLFADCTNLTSLDLSNWDTSKVTHMSYMFAQSINLTSLDLSNFVTSNLGSMEAMFHSCQSLTSLDLSNWDASKVNNTNWVFTNNTNIANIGMIYCDFKTVEKVASVIPTTNPTTIWVGNHIDINGLPQYDHITYKVYEVEDKLEVELSSPLLEGDRLEIIDGDLYHYHKMREFNIDGNWWFSESKTESGWTLNDNVYACYTYGDTYSNQFITDLKPKGKLLSDQFATRTVDEIYTTKADQEGISVRTGGSPEGCIGFRINKDRLNSVTIQGMFEYVTKNPVHIVAELLNPYYELVKPNVGLLNAEQGLYLNISDSVVPVVNHQDLCTLKLNYLLPNVQYKVKFKANNAGSIAINLGGTLVPLDVVEGWNEVMVTTPETLVDEYLKINGSEGIKIQNVMVIDSNKDFDYFKGMNNTFDEIPVKNICTNRTLTYTHGVDEEGVSPQGEMNVNVSKGKVITVVGKVSNNPDNLPISINLYNDTGRATGKNLFNPEWFEDYIIEGGDQEYLDNGYVMFDYSKAYNKDFNINYAENTQYKIDLELINIMDQTPDGYGKYNANARINVEYTDGSKQHVWSPSLTHANKTIKRIYFAYGFYGHTVYIQLDKLLIYKWKGYQDSAYEPFRNYVNDNPIFIDTTSSVALIDEGEVDVSVTDGYFAITIRADRDYANRIGFNVGDAFACEENDQVTITDLMVFEGDILDCQPTTYVDPADTRYLVEYKSIGNPFGFGKNKLI